MVLRMLEVAGAAILVFTAAAVFSQLMTSYYLPRALTYAAWVIAFGWVFEIGRRIFRRR